VSRCTNASSRSRRMATVLATVLRRESTALRAMRRRVAWISLFVFGGVRCEPTTKPRQSRACRGLGGLCERGGGNHIYVTAATAGTQLVPPLASQSRQRSADLHHRNTKSSQ
jgi:hypothetical protein